MILYVNGCSHTAAAEALSPECYAVDDGKHGIDRRPHSDNLKVSWGYRLAQYLNFEFVCDAESGGSNPRIIRTTREWLDKQQSINDVFVILQWTTWEREEWYHQGHWYQVNASGVDWVPDDLRERYKNFIVNVDWMQNTINAHLSIWEFHKELLDRKVNHLFFSGHSTFSDIQNHYNWGRYYLAPYDRDMSYHNWLLKNGGEYANPNTYHFNASSHKLWADFMLTFLRENKLLEFND